ncbi:hypothetical protein TNCV_255221 [Trichonephila clavipes]|nr:hypothetical protein TNCV_255221 [Trichonephila clavipes]
MAEYTNAEKEDMILAYGATDCNGRAAQRLYVERPPFRRTPAHTMFARHTSNYVRPVHSRRQHVIEIGRHVPN